ncbi:cytidylyltransferase domain-containing protein [Lacrimispora xylanisolvens]|uniref:cytidylyltransferase domain-containing protein n=1 Tax=Lacrimispora xylanisolvens TaxID=384636 RepID=UPI003D9CACB1
MIELEKTHVVNNEILAIISARSGSKGIKNKNIRMLAGKPLLAHSIEYVHEKKEQNL